MDPEGRQPNDTGTAAHAAAENLLARADRSRKSFHFTPDAQFVTDEHGMILEANHAAAELLRCPKEFLTGKPLALFGGGGTRQQFYAAIVRLVRGGASESFEAHLARRGEAPRQAYVVGWADAGGDRTTGTLHWLVRDVTDLRRSQADRDELQRQLAGAQEAERRRISRDLHDTLGQTLAALALGVRAVRDAAPLPERAVNRLDHVQRMADELGRQLHELASRLRPTALDDLGLAAAAGQLAADWSARTGVAADFQLVGPATRFPAEVETALYRVVQEALTNAAKHAGATRVAVVLGRNGGDATAVIEDDGAGFNADGTGAAAARGRRGLLGMRERVTLVGGTLTVESAPGQGTTVIARIPLPPGLY
jgi:signal transduction histidine kinase